MISSTVYIQYGAMSFSMTFQNFFSVYQSISDGDLTSTLTLAFKILYNDDDSLMVCIHYRFPKLTN